MKYTLSITEHDAGLKSTTQDLPTVVEVCLCQPFTRKMSHLTC